MHQRLSHELFQREGSTANVRHQQKVVPLTYDRFNSLCSGLPATTYVVHWGGSHVWKVGGKVFAIGGWEDNEPRFAFKVSSVSYEILKGQPGLRPAPYLASRGLKWIQHYTKPGLADDELEDYIRQSHAIVAEGLSRKARAKLGLITRTDIGAAG